jgi:DNA-binding PadR family transcriptional regulator
MPGGLLGDFELAVLLAVARLGRDAYGASVRRDLSARARRDYSVGAVYTTLQRLEDKRLLESWMSEATALRGGRAKRCFKLTAAGLRTLKHAREVTAALWSGLDPKWKPV